MELSEVEAETRRNRIVQVNLWPSLTGSHAHPIRITYLDGKVCACAARNDGIRDIKSETLGICAPSSDFINIANTISQVLSSGNRILIQGDHDIIPLTIGGIPLQVMLNCASLPRGRGYITHDGKHRLCRSRLFDPIRAPYLRTEIRPCPAWYDGIRNIENKTLHRRIPISNLFRAVNIVCNGLSVRDISGGIYWKGDLIPILGGGRSAGSQRINRVRGLAGDRTALQRKHRPHDKDQCQSQKQSCEEKYFIALQLPDEKKVCPLQTVEGYKVYYCITKSRRTLFFAPASSQIHDPPRSNA